MKRLKKSKQRRNRERKAREARKWRQVCRDLVKGIPPEELAACGIV